MNRLLRIAQFDALIELCRDAGSVYLRIRISVPDTEGSMCSRDLDDFMSPSYPPRISYVREADFSKPMPVQPNAQSILPHPKTPENALNPVKVDPECLFLGSVWQPLHHIFPPRHTDDWYTRNLPYSPLQLSIIRRHNINLALHHPINNTIICINTLMITLHPRPPLIPRNPQRNPILRTQLLQLRHYTRRDDRDTIRIQRIHQCF